MRIPFNSSGLPKGLGCLQVRGRVYWAIYTDETGRSLQVNTQTADETEARLFLAQRAAAVLQAKLAAVLGVLGEGHHQPGAAAGAAGRQGAHRKSAQAHARGRKTNSQGGSR